MSDDDRASQPENATGRGEPRQRWRICFSRDAAGSGLAQRETIETWQAGLTTCGLPVLFTDGSKSRPRLAVGAPLPVGVIAERELADVWLTRRLPIAVVRGPLELAMPEGHRIRDLWDVWLGEPALAGRVVAADYRLGVVVDGGSPSIAAGALADRLREGAAALLRADTIPRERPKSGGMVRYDLRPLLGAIDIGDEESAGDAEHPSAVIRVRTIIDPERGSGRPDEVLAALAEASGLPLAADRTVRERLVLAGER